VKHFIDVELSDVDTRLATVGTEWRNFPPQQVGRAIGCDALLYGEVTDAGRLYLALYSQLTVAAVIRLVDVATGQTLAQESYATKFREAGVPLSPLSVVPDVVKTWMNLSETQMTRAIDDLGRNLAEKVPDLPAIQPSTPEQGAIASAPPSPPPMAPTPGREVATTFVVPTSHPVPTVTVATIRVPAPVSGVTEKIRPALPSRPAMQEQYRLQVAAFRTYDDAQRLVRLLRDNGHPAMIAQIGESAHMWNQVVLGPFPSRAAALKVGMAIRKLAPLSPVVIPRLGR
jgi:cell division septation protein DedD